MFAHRGTFVGSALLLDRWFVLTNLVRAQKLNGNERAISRAGRPLPPPRHRRGLRVRADLRALEGDGRHWPGSQVRHRAAPRDRLVAPRFDLEAGRHGLPAGPWFAKR